MCHRQAGLHPGAPRVTQELPGPRQEAGGFHLHRSLTLSASPASCAQFWLWALRVELKQTSVQTLPSPRDIG